MDILEELDTLRLGPSEYKIVQKAYTEIERLREALKYARRFLNAKDHDVVFIDSALQQKDSE